MRAAASTAGCAADDELGWPKLPWSHSQLQDGNLDKSMWSKPREPYGENVARRNSFSRVVDEDFDVEGDHSRFRDNLVVNEHPFEFKGTITEIAETVDRKRFREKLDAGLILDGKDSAWKKYSKEFAATSAPK